MKENILIIIGIPSLKYDLKIIDKLNPKEIYTTDGISYVLFLNKTSINVSDVLMKRLHNEASLYTKKIFLNDRDNVEKVSREISLKKDNYLPNVLEYFLSWNMIELLRLKEFIKNKNNSIINIVTTKDYLKLLKDVVDIKQFSNVIVRDIRFLDFAIYLNKSSLISYFGRINFLRYSIGFTLLSILKSWKNEKIKDNFLVSDNHYSLNAVKILFPNNNFQSLDKYWKVSLFFFLRNYIKAYRNNLNQLRNNNGLKRILRVTPLLYPSVKFLYGPYLYCIKIRMKELFTTNNISTIVQHTDASPHRRLIVFEAKKNFVKTIVTNHGFLADPLMITDIKSQLLFTSSKGYSKYSHLNPFSDHEEIIDISNSQKSNSKGSNILENKNNFIFILTNGYSGYSLRNSLQDNFELIKEVLSKAKKFNAQNNIIIKIHPSESKKLYEDHFKGIKVIDTPLNKISHQIERVIISTTSALFYLKSNCKIYYSSSGQRCYQYPKTNNYTINEIIKDSILK